MSLSIKLTTTGTLSPVVIDDLGQKSFTHPTTGYELVSSREFTPEELGASSDLQNALDSGYITMTRDGYPITDLSDISSSTTKLKNAIYVSKSGSDSNADGTPEKPFLTIKAACDYIATQSPSSTNPWSVIVYPGVYLEDAMTVPSYCNLVCAGGLRSAVVQANTNTDTLITCGAYSEIYGFLVTGCNGVGGIGIKSTSFQSLVRSCIISNCETALVFSGSGANCIAQDLVLVRLPGTTLTTPILVEAGATATIQAATISGTPISLITTGIKITGSGTNATLSAINTAYCTTGVLVESDAQGILSTLAVSNCTTGYDFTGTNTNVQGNACAARDCTTAINIGSATVSGYFRGSANSENITRASGNDIFFLDIVTFQEGEEGFEFGGNVSVGTHRLPSRLVGGTGHATTEEQYVFTNTNGEVGTWNDITAANNDPNTTISLFAGTGAGNCVYIGVEDHVFKSLYIQNIVTALSLGTGSVVSEYWNGSTWVSFNLMSTQGKTQYGNATLQRLGTDNIFFGEMDGWTTKTLNGQSAYWARYRIVTAITTIPAVTRMEHYLDCAVIEREGYIELHGEAQVVYELPLSLMTDIQGFNSSNVPLNANTNTYLVVENNDRDSNRKDGSGGTVRIPAGLNTSLPITFRILFAVGDTSSGNVENEMYLAEVSAGAVLNGGITEIGPVGDVVAVGGTALKVYESVHQFDIPDALPNETYIWSLIRDATGGNPDDTYGDYTYIVGWTCEGTFWR